MITKTDCGRYAVTITRLGVRGCPWALFHVAVTVGLS